MRLRVRHAGKGVEFKGVAERSRTLDGTRYRAACAC